MLVLGAVFAACGDEGPSPPATAGTVEVRLVSPHGIEGAMVVEVAHFGQTAQPASGALHQRQDGGGLRVLVIGNGSEPLAFQLPLPDVTDPPVHRIIEVAGPDDRLRTDLEGYRLEFVP